MSKMNRRSAVRNFMVFSAGITLLPSCWQEDSKASIPLKNILVSGGQEKMMAGLTEAILPATGTPAVPSHHFVLMMVDDCFNKEAREKFVGGLRQFDEVAKKRIGATFAGANAEQRAELLKAIESKRDIPADVLAFYHSTKRLTIQSFTGSRYYLTEVRRYEMVPGRFHGCFPVANSK